MPNDTSPPHHEGLSSICELAEDLAKQEGIHLTSILIDDGRPIVASDYHLLSLTSGDCSVCEKLHHEELANRNGRTGNSLTEAKIRGAVERLRVLLHG